MATTPLLSSLPRRRIEVRLNRGTVTVLYAMVVGSDRRTRAGWWIEGREGLPSGLDTIETMIVETLIRTEMGGKPSINGGF